MGEFLLCCWNTKGFLWLIKYGPTEYLNQLQNLSFCCFFFQFCAEWISDSSCSLFLPGRFCRGDSKCCWAGSPTASPRNECICCQESDRRGAVECWATRTGIVSEFGRSTPDILPVSVTSFSWSNIDMSICGPLNYFCLMILSLPISFQQCKLGIVKFIEAKQVPEVETVVHLVVASSDTRHSVATAADLELKSKQRWVKKLWPSLYFQGWKSYAHLTLSFWFWSLH